MLLMFCAFQSLIGKVIQRQFVSLDILYTKYSRLSSKKIKNRAKKCLIVNDINLLIYLEISQKIW